MAYDTRHIWDGSDRHGASLKAYELLGKKKGYQLVGTNITGVNAFFVRDDLTLDRFITPSSAEYLYNPLRLNLKFSSYHPAKYFLGGQKPYYGLLNYQNIEFVLGFHSVERYNDQKFIWSSENNSIFRFIKWKEIVVRFHTKFQILLNWII